MTKETPKHALEYYIFEVWLYGDEKGTDEKKIIRKIQIAGTKSLYNFARTITQAFGFYFDHCFGFYDTLKDRLNCKKAFELFVDIGEEPTNGIAKGVKKEKISQAFKHIGEKMIFLFDYGDGWQFNVELKEIRNFEGIGLKPIILESIGKAPLQYPPCDDEIKNEEVLHKNFKTNWIIKEAAKTNSKKNVVTLENPDMRDYLDRLLLKKFWPIILRCLKESCYNYSQKPGIESELSCDLERSLLFMLFDENRAFFKGKLNISRDAWMLESDFFLSLPENTDSQAIFQILGNSRFKGYPPTLIIDRDRKNDFYQIHFHSGNGAGGGRHDKDYIGKEIERVISINIEMFELSKSGITTETAGEFLTLAYEAYEAF